MTVSSVSVFGPESVSYERSRCETRTKFHDFSARVCFAKIPKSQYSMIYTILRFFRILFLKNVLVPKCPGRARARPHGPGPWAGPILGHGQAQNGPGQAHIWAWAGPNMGLEYIGICFWILENIKKLFFHIFLVCGNMSKRKIKIFP